MPHEPKDWINSASVRFTHFARAAYDRDYPKREVEITRRYGCDTLVYFVEIDGLMLYPSRHADMDKTIKSRDLIVEIREECRRRRVRFVAAFMGMHCQTYHMRQNPEWCLKHHSSVFKDSPFAGHKRNSFEKEVMSLHSPYREILLGKVTEVLTHYTPDGIFFDGVYHPPGYDYSDWAQTKFRERFGRDIPADPMDPDWLVWHQEHYVGFARDARTVVDQHHPAAALILDFHGPTVGTYDAGESIAAASPYLDAIVLESYFECSGEHPRFVAQECLLAAAETRLPIWWARWLSRSAGHLPVTVPKATALVWLNDVVSTSTVPAVVDQDAFLHDRTLEKPVGQAMRRARRLRRWIGATEPVRHVALLHATNRKFERMHDNLLMARSSFEGSFRALEEGHIPFSIITERDILEGQLASYRSLMLPNVEELSDELLSAIRAYVAGGGGLVATFRTSFRDEHGTERPKPGLADVLGVRRVTGGVWSGPRYGAYDYGWPSLTSPAHLFEVIASHPVTRGLLHKNLYSYAGRLIDAAVSRDTTSLVRTRLWDKQLQASGRFFRHQPTQEYGPQLVFVRKHGLGRVVWFAGDIDYAIWKNGTPECMRLLLNAVSWASRGPAQIACQAPPSLVMRVRQNCTTGGLQISFTNYAQAPVHTPRFSGVFNRDGPTLAKAFRRTEWPAYVSPVKDIQVHVKRIGKRLPRVETLSGRNPTVRPHQGKLHLSFDEIIEGEVVLLLPQ